jgi:hypothetical protein
MTGTSPIKSMAIVQHKQRDLGNNLNHLYVLFVFVPLLLQVDFERPLYQSATHGAFGRRTGQGHQNGGALIAQATVATRHGGMGCRKVLAHDTFGDCGGGRMGGVRVVARRGWGHHCRRRQGGGGATGADHHGRYLRSLIVRLLLLLLWLVIIPVL